MTRNTRPFHYGSEALVCLVIPIRFQKSGGGSVPIPDFTSRDPIRITYTVCGADVADNSKQKFFAGNRLHTFTYITPIALQS